jgi:hypothetical protein
MSQTLGRNEFAAQFGTGKLLLLNQENARAVQRQPNSRARASRASARDRHIKLV